MQIIGNSSFGGGSYILIQWCKFLIENKCDVYVLTTDEHTIDELEKIVGIKIISNIFIPRNVNIFYQVKAIFALFQLCKKESFQIVHTYTATPGFVGRISAKLAKVPIILHHQAAWSISESKSILTKIIYIIFEYIAIKSTSKSICVSNTIADQSKELLFIPQDKLVVINNGINPAPFLNIKPAETNKKLLKIYNIKDDSFVIGTICRISESKDLYTFVKAFSIYKKYESDRSIYGVIIGDGPSSLNVKKLIYKLGLENVVFMLGFRNDIPNLLSTMDIYLFTSLREGLSISLLEAMASGRPIIATDIKPNQELIENDITGLLIPPGDSFQIYQAIMKYQNNPTFARACAENARKLIIEKFSLKLMFNQTWALYNNLYKQTYYKNSF